MAHNAQLVISTSLCIIAPVVGVLAIEQVGGGVFNGFAASRSTEASIGPDTILAWTAVLALISFSFASVALVRNLRREKLPHHRIGAGLLWLLAGVATASVWVVWSWSW